MGIAIMARSFCKDAPEILSLLEAFGLPTTTDLTPEQLAQAALSDKKRSGDTLTLAVPRAIGRCELEKIPVTQWEALIRAGW